MEKYNLPSQTTTLFLDGPQNYQGLHSDSPNYQNLRKKPLLAKYLHNTHVTCHFSIQKKKKIQKSEIIKILKIIFLIKI